MTLSSDSTDPATESASPRAAPELHPKDVREAVDMTPAEMADLLDMSVFGYQSWEAGRRRPGGPARQLLRLINEDVDAVKRLLARAA